MTVVESSTVPTTTAPSAPISTLSSSSTSSTSVVAMTNSITPCVEDQIEVGSSAILSSPHVSEGPGRIAKSPVPSVYADDRGDIHRLRVGGNRINLLYSRKNVMRSGYFHPHATYDFIVSGTIELWTLNSKGTDKTIYKAHQYFTIPAYIPHILYFLEDTVVVEWYEKGTEFQCYYYHPYRNIVDLQNSIFQSDSEQNNNNNNNRRKTGRNQRLVPQDDIYNISGSSSIDKDLYSYNSNNSSNNNNKGRNGSSSTTTSMIVSILQSSFVLFSTATIAFTSGLVIGFLLNDHHKDSTTGTRSGSSSRSSA